MLGWENLIFKTVELHPLLCLALLFGMGFIELRSGCFSTTRLELPVHHCPSAHWGIITTLAITPIVPQRLLFMAPSIRNMGGE